MLPQIVSTVLFIAILGLIFSEKMNRTITAIAGAALMLIFGHFMGFYSQEQAIEAIDFNTLGLLLGMMMLVALLEPTGVFEYLAVWAGKLSRGKPVLLLVLLGSVTTLLSMFLDNVTTVVLVAPVTILICEILGVKPAPFLVAEALLSNTGGAATLVGDPPNVLIGSAAELTFTDFLSNSLPVVVVAWLAALFVLRFSFRRELHANPEAAEAIRRLDPSQALNDPRTGRRVVIVLAFAVLLFFLQGPLGIEPSLVALSAAAVALVWVRPDMEKTFKHVEWNVLGFFTALFIMVGGLEHAGVFEILVGLIENAVGLPPVLLGVLTIWLVAIISALVDNIPITIALIPIIQGLGAHGMDVAPLWWALVFGAGFGGNGTIIGSSANVIVATLSEKTRSPITSAQWSRHGLPVMLVTCLIASLIFALAYPMFVR